MNTEIAEISPVADSQTGNFTVKAQIENNGLIIKPGMFLKCSLSSNEGEVFPVIPETALIQEGENNFSVFCVVKGILVKKSVKIIEKKDGFIWLETGVTVGDEIIDEPSPFLKEGQIVNKMVEKFLQKHLDILKTSLIFVVLLSLTREHNYYY